MHAQSCRKDKRTLRLSFFAFGRFSERFSNKKASLMAGLTGFWSFMPNLALPEFHPFPPLILSVNLRQS